jgi:hypothetical protein
MRASVHAKSSTENPVEDFSRKTSSAIMIQATQQVSLLVQPVIQLPQPELRIQRELCQSLQAQS